MGETQHTLFRLDFNRSIVIEGRPERLAADAWLKRAMPSRLEPIKKVTRSIRAHENLILNWFDAKKEFSSGIVESLSYRIKLTVRKAYGFKTLETAEIALYHTLGRLPEPQLAHEFC